MPLLTVSRAFGWPVVRDGLAARRAVPQEPGPVKLRRQRQTRAVIEGELSRVVDVEWQRVQAEQRGDGCPALTFLAHAPYGALHLGVRRQFELARNGGPLAAGDGTAAPVQFAKRCTAAASASLVSGSVGNGVPLLGSRHDRPEGIGLLAPNSHTLA